MALIVTKDTDLNTLRKDGELAVLLDQIGSWQFTAPSGKDKRFKFRGSMAMGNTGMSEKDQNDIGWLYKSGVKLVCMLIVPESLIDIDQVPEEEPKS
jgi:hypothetical protein